MKHLLQSAAVIALTGWLCSCSNEKTTANYQIIPMPLEVKTADAGEFVLGDNVKIVYPAGNEAMARNAGYLAEYLKKATGMNIAVTTEGAAKGNISLSIQADENEPEGYKLCVNADGVTITGGSEAGVFYGIQTLRKSIPVVKNSEPTLPAVEITDAPRFDYRGTHIDVSRHFFNVDEMKTIIDMMVLHNMNRLHWHLTDDQGWRIEIKKYPELTTIGSKRTETVIGRNTGEYDGKPYEGFYTQEDIKEIIDYAAQRYVTIIPEIDLPGHMQAALAAYPNLGCTGGPYEVWRQWGVSEDVLCAGNDEVLTFIDNVLKEVVELFPSEYIHIGGDECPKVRWKECAKCQARAKALGIKGDDKHTTEEYLQSFIINHAEKYLNSLGRQIIGWDEILEGGLAPNATVMSWRGEGGGIEAAKQKHDVIMTPNTYLYFDYYQTKDIDNEPLAIGGYLPVQNVYNYEPMPDALTEEEQKYIKGVQANVWTEYMPTFEQLQYMVLPRYAALCEVQWSAADKKDYKNFSTRLPQLIDTYRAEGYNFATHVFDVTADFNTNPDKGTLDITLTTIDDADIHYTLDGTTPTAASQKVNGTVSIDANADFAAVAVRKEGNSRVLKEKITFGKSTCKPITANQPVNKQYEFKGVITLNDGLKGNGNYKTGRWIAFYRNDMDVTIDMQEPTEMQGVSFSTCVEKGDWVFDVRGVTIEVSDDGKTFKQVFKEDYPAMTEKDRNGVYDHKYSFEKTTARYIRILGLSEQSIPEWHGGKGLPGFLFVDEIVVE